MWDWRLWEQLAPHYHTLLNRLQNHVLKPKFLKGIILTEREIGLLGGLNGPTKFMIRYEPDLYRYLRRLEGLNFIQPNPLITIEERHKVDEELPIFDLKEFVCITDDGKRRLNMLGSSQNLAQSPPGCENIR